MTPLIAAAPQFVQPEIWWTWLAPYLLVLGAAVVGVLVEAFVAPRARRSTQLTLALVALLVALWATPTGRALLQIAGAWWDDLWAALTGIVT